MSNHTITHGSLVCNAATPERIGRLFDTNDENGLALVEYRSNRGTYEDMTIENLADIRLVDEQDPYHPEDPHMARAILLAKASMDRNGDIPDHKTLSTYSTVRRMRDALANGI